MSFKLTRKVFNKKGAEPSASSSAVVVLLIGVIIIFYLLSVSPSERERLLGDYNGTEEDDGSNSNNYEYLLRENIGRVTKAPYSERDHDFSAVSVNTKTDAQILKHMDSIYVRDSAFTKLFPKMNFNVDSDLSQNLKLSFNVEKAKGVLFIYLNGNEIFSGEIKYTSPPAIEISNEYLQESNTLEFYLYRPSWAFWRIEEYELKNINIIGDVKDTSLESAELDMYISDLEYTNINEATFFFLPDCTLGTVGKLSIFLNNRKIYYAIPDCGIQNYVILDPYDLSSGRNNIKFKTEQGYYLLDQLRLKTELKDQVFPTYYFELEDNYFSDDDYDNPELNENNYEVNVTLRFTNRDYKDLTLWINGYAKRISTTDVSYEFNIDTFALPGSNSIEIVPESDDVSVAELRVILFEDD